MQHNVLAMSGRAVEAAGDVNTLAARQDGHHHLGNRQATRVHSRSRRHRGRTGRRRAVVVACRRNSGGPLHRRAGEREVWTARSRTGFASGVCSVHGQTRMSGVNLNGFEIRKGAADAIARLCRAEGARFPAPGSGRSRADRALRRHSAGGRREEPRRSGRHRAEGRRQGRHARTLRSTARHGHPHRHDHRRQSADRGGHRARSRGRRLPGRRPRRKTRWT